QRPSCAHMTAAAVPAHQSRCIDGGRPGRCATRDLHDTTGLLVEEERHAHATRARDLLDQPADVLVERAGIAKVGGPDLGPHELAAELALHARERESP